MIQGSARTGKNFEKNSRRGGYMVSDRNRQLSDGYNIETFKNEKQSTIYGISTKFNFNDRNVLLWRRRDSERQGPSSPQPGAGAGGMRNRSEKLTLFAEN